MGKLKIVCFKKKITALSNYKVEIEKIITDYCGNMKVTYTSFAILVFQ